MDLLGVPRPSYPGPSPHAFAPAHFNARGELIPYAFVPRPSQVASVPVHDAAMKADPGSPDTDLDNMELAYPDDEPTNLVDPTPPPPPPESPSPLPYTPPTPSHSKSPPTPAPATRRPLPRRAPRSPAIALPTVPVVYTVPRAGLVPSVPPRALPVPMPMPIPVHPVSMPMPPPPMPMHPIPIPMAAPAPAPVQAPCATAGCAGTAPAVGRRCLACVRGSWVGRREEKAKAAETDAATATPVKRVTIKLKVTPKSKVTLDSKAASGEAGGDKKGKGKAVEASPKEGTAADAADAGSWGGEGWDSDLSALTDSDGENEVKAKEPPRPSFKIRIPARTPSGSPIKTPPAKASPASALPTPPASTAGTPEAPRLCTIARCRVPLPPLALYRWKCCSACRKQYREYQRDRLARLAGSKVPASPTPTTSTPADAVLPPPRPTPLPPHIEALRAHAAQKEWERAEKERALELVGAQPVPRARAPEPAGTCVASGVQVQRKVEVVDGARVCTGRACGHIIPAEAEYVGSLCAVCRGRERRKAVRELAKDGKDAGKEKVKEKEAEAEVEDFPLAPMQRPGRCIYADCGTLMPVDSSEVSVAECEQCLRRKMIQRRPPGRPPGSRNKSKYSTAVTPAAKPLATQKLQPKTTATDKPVEAPRKRKRVSPYPAYQCRDALLKDFGTRFHGFIEAQSYYFLMRSGTAEAAQPPAQAMFDFSGEYSVVARDLDVIARKAEVEIGVHSVKDAVARAGGLEFSPTSWVSILGSPGGVVTRFACVHLVNVYLPIRVPPGHPPNPARPKSMQGELEIAVLPDDSHKYFAGEKTIVRFRLVG
ncbi:hypothetical protein FB451DRAFT_1563134 [Mycena latifolia]|nr:hypothetical protein FB451DRAFT_1563134 [Mycena latifolia]